MKTSFTRFITGAALLTTTVAGLSACTYHRTVVERPAAAPNTTVVVPDRDHKDVIVVPNE